MQLVKDLLQKRRDRQASEQHRRELIDEGTVIVQTSSDLKRRGIDPPVRWGQRIDEILRELRELR